MSENGWVLCVDDDERLLSGLELQLGFDYEVRTATSGKVGLALLAEHPDCAVIVSDMRMPEMNGAQFLAESRLITPDSTRLLLTGFSDITDTVSAVNEGGIFRFLTKPIPPEALIATIEDSLRQWELVRSERVLLEQTLHGAAQALIEALEIASPAVFSRSRRVEAGCRHVASALHVEPVWEVALAGLLLRTGWISLPQEVIERRLAGEDPTPHESSMLADALSTTVRLIERIPRLDGVAEIVRGSALAPTPDPSSRTPTAGSIVRTVADFDDSLARGASGSVALARMKSTHDEAILSALRGWECAGDEATIKEVRLAQLLVGMTIERDIATSSGSLLVSAGSDVTETLLQRLRNFAHTHGVEEPIIVSARGRAVSAAPITLTGVRSNR